MLELDAEAQAVIAKVQKLLALSQGNANEHEAAAASAKAMELLAAYNLDMAIVGKTAKGGQRSDTRLKGGLYSWQRDLWNAVASLNFCKYYFILGLSRGSSYEHQIIGRQENVIATKVMADYLQQAVERLARDYGKNAYPGYSIFIKELIAFREGCAQRLAERLWDLRRQRIRDDEAKAREQAAASRHPGSAPGTGLVLASVINTEEDLNNDYIMNYEPGTSAKRRAESEARRAAAKAAADEALRKQEEWDLAHPEEAAIRKAAEKQAQEDFWAKWAREDNTRKPQRERKKTAREERAGMSTYYSGYRKGDDIGLDKQVDHNPTKRIK